MVRNLQVCNFSFISCVWYDIFNVIKCEMMYVCDVQVICKCHKMSACGTDVCVCGKIVMYVLSAAKLCMWQVSVYVRCVKRIWLRSGVGMWVWGFMSACGLPGCWLTSVPATSGTPGMTIFSKGHAGFFREFYFFWLLIKTSQIGRASCRERVSSPV